MARVPRQVVTCPLLPVRQRSAPAIPPMAGPDGAAEELGASPAAGEHRHGDQASQGCWALVASEAALTSP